MCLTAISNVGCSALYTIGPCEEGGVNVNVLVSQLLAPGFNIGEATVSVIQIWYVHSCFASLCSTILSFSVCYSFAMDMKNL